MRRVPTYLILLGTFMAGAQAGGQTPARSAAGAESVESLKKEFEDALKKWSDGYRKEVEAAKRAGTQKAIKIPSGYPGPIFSVRFLKLAAQNPDGPDAIDALIMVLRTSAGPDGKPTETRGQAVKILRYHYVTKPEIKRVLNLMTNLDDDDAIKLVDDVIARNPDRKIQAAAYRGMINHREQIVEVTSTLKKDERRRRAVEASMGKARVAELITQAERFEKDLVKLKETLHSKYKDLVVDLSIGKSAPEVASRDIDGKTVRLSELKGNVVVLDLWATWCGPCKAMIPHHRAMVERLKGKPFALVSISFDEKLETIQQFLSKEKMPWTHWWNGTEGAMTEDWNVRYFPTIYVIDANGVFRYKDLRDEELEKAVNTLLEEAKNKPAKAA